MVRALSFVGDLLAMRRVWFSTAKFYLSLEVLPGLHAVEVDFAVAAAS